MFKSVLKKEQAERSVLEYVPQKFELGTPQQALEYLEYKKSNPGADFKMSDAIRIQTGVAGIEQVSVEQKIEEIVLERIKEIQEKAYQEAYQLGLDEGRHDAFTQSQDQINQSIEVIHQLTDQMLNLKKDLVSANEEHIMKMIYYMASRIAMFEIKGNEEAVLGVIKKSLEMSQSEETVVVQVSEKQLNFLEELQKETKKEFEFLKKVKFEGSATVTEGGCVIRTNYGTIDAQLEERINKLWTSIVDTLPKAKHIASVAS